MEPNTQCIAHFRADGEVQELSEHLSNVAYLSSRFAAAISAPNAGSLLGILHDLGKHSQHFQRYLNSAAGLLDQDRDEGFSALQHLAFCERQWGLIHLEQQWSENRLTAEGRQMHERAHEASNEVRDGVRICRSLRLRSLRLGVAGVADVVEFRPRPDGPPQPYPIEYKHGKPKPGRWDEVQICAQALCLEEMTHTDVPEGAIFYGQPRRRMAVQFEFSLREETERLCARLHELQQRGLTPTSVPAPHCERCSLKDVCLPDTVSGRSAARYNARAVASILAEK
jgi:CRISPR-associated exonuclease Cas4